MAGRRLVRVKPLLVNEPLPEGAVALALHIVFGVDGKCCGRAGWQLLLQADYRLPLSTTVRCWMILGASILSDDQHRFAGALRTDLKQAEAGCGEAADAWVSSDALPMPSPAITRWKSTLATSGLRHRRTVLREYGVRRSRWTEDRNGHPAPPTT